MGQKDKKRGQLYKAATAGYGVNETGKKGKNTKYADFNHGLYQPFIVTLNFVVLLLMGKRSVSID